MFLPVTSTLKLVVNYPPEVEIHVQGDRAPGRKGERETGITWITAPDIERVKRPQGIGNWPGRKWDGDDTWSQEVWGQDIRQDTRGQGQGKTLNKRSGRIRELVYRRGQG